MMEWSNWFTAATVVFTSVIVWKWFRTKKSSKNTDPKKTTVPEPSSPIIAAAEKNHSSICGSVYDNKAYKENEVANSVAVTYFPNDSTNNAANQDLPATDETCPATTTNDTTSHLHHKISDVSTVFRPPSPDEKTFSEFLTEKFDRKTMTLRSQRFDPDDATENIVDELSQSEDSEHEQHRDITLNHTTTDGEIVSNDAIADVYKPESLVPKDVLPIKSNPKVQTSAEWQEKLKKLDLFNDDDEDFEDDSTDSETEDEDTQAQPFKNGINESNRQEKKVITPCSPTNKIVSERAIVIDNGSYMVRGGWAGEFRPIACSRNITGSWRAEASEAWQEMLGSKFIGETAIQRHSTLSLEQPIEDGKVNNWKSLQEVLQHVVGKEMEADMTHHPIIITEPINVDKKQREKMIEIFIEQHRCPGVCLKSQAAMCAFSVSHKVGLVINSGYGTTEVVPVYEGYPLPQSSATLGIGGRHITDYLIRLLQTEKGLSFSTVAEVEIANTIKEAHAEVPAANIINSRKSLIEEPKEYELPDGRVVELGDEMKRCTEPLFSPGLVGNSSLGIPSLVQHTLERLDADIMTESDNNILLAGGNSNLSGLKMRLELDVAEKMNGLKAAFKQSVSGDNCAWIGASIVAEQSNFSDICVTDDLYFDHGGQIVHRLCM